MRASFKLSIRRLPAPLFGGVQSWDNVGSSVATIPEKSRCDCGRRSPQFVRASFVRPQDASARHFVEREMSRGRRAGQTKTALARSSASRREWLRWAGAAGLAGFLPAGCSPTPPAARLTDEPFARFPEKVPLRVVNDRPPCLETPWRYFREDLTPNEAFYVRWHLQAFPTVIDLRTWRLRVAGHVERPLELSMDDLEADGARFGGGRQPVLRQLP